MGIIKGLCEEISPSQVPEAMVCLEKEKVAVVFNGPPAHGKTWAAIAGAKAIARETYGIDGVIDTRSGRRPKEGEYFISQSNTTSYDPEDYCMPAFATKQLGGDGNCEVYERRAVTSLAGADETWYQHGMTWETLHGVELFEEIGKKPENFKIFAEMLNERSLGTNYLVPPNVYQAATTNNAEDGAGAHALHTDLSSRVCQITVRNNVKDFMAFHDGELDDLIRALIGIYKDDILFTQEYEPRGKAFAGPRTWMKVNRLMSNGLDLDNPVHQAIVLGLIGTKATVEMLAARRMDNQITDLDAMLQDPDLYKERIHKLARNSEGAHSHNGRQLLVSLVVTLGKRMRTDPNEFPRYMKFAEMLTDEFAVTFAHMTMAQAEARDKEATKKGAKADAVRSLKESPAWSDHRVKNHSYYS